MESVLDLLDVTDDDNEGSGNELRRFGSDWSEGRAQVIGWLRCVYCLSTGKLFEYAPC